MIAGLVLAAGEGRRFGGLKQLADLEGRPLLEHVLAAMARAPVDRTVVVLGARAHEVLSRVDLQGAEPVLCHGWYEGMAASLQAGLTALGGVEAVVVVPGDQPRLEPEAVARVLAARAPDANAVRATYGGAPGHPVVLERSLFPQIATLSGDAGARELLARVRVREVECEDLGGAEDVDTVDQLEALRAKGAPL